LNTSKKHYIKFLFIIVFFCIYSCNGSNGNNNDIYNNNGQGSINKAISYYLDDFDYPYDSLNNFVASRGTWCCNKDYGCSACNANNLSVSFDEITYYGNKGASLKLTYTVEEESSLASYYENLHNDNTFHDLSEFEEFNFWVRGEENTISSDTQFYIRFTDKDWNIEYVEIMDVSDEWQKKIVDIGALSNVDLKNMREITIIFEHNQDNGRYTFPLSGTLYFDNLVFLDKDLQIDNSEKFIDLLEKRTFRYFWDYADPNTGLIRDRASDSGVCSIAAVGFGLTSICIAEYRKWITYEEAYNRVLCTLNSFYDDPADPNDFCVEGCHGLFWHFIDIHNGKPMYWDGVSTIDSALLMAGILFCKQYFSGTEIETLATKIYESAEWDWFINNDGLMYAIWTPANGLTGCWGGYNEAMILYLLAIGSPTHSISANSWDAWASFYNEHWGAYYGFPILTCPALFIHQYSHCWIDFRNKKDEYVDYFQNSKFATLANRAYSKEWYPNPNIDLWGITACDGPVPDTCAGKTYRAGLGYPPDSGNNDGTIAPTAVGGSIVFTPQHSISTLKYMYDNYNQKLWGLYGLKDSLNIACEPNWFANDYIGIDIGAMLIMIENYRSNLVWDIFMQNIEIIDAMNRVGFSSGDMNEASYFYYQEAEEYSTKLGNGIDVEDHPTAWNKKTLQLGPDADNYATYTINFDLF